jgi:hypothetical protein
VIVVSVGEEDGFGGGAAAQEGEVREGLFAFLLGVHPGVEDDIPSGEGEGVAICPDLDMAREV